MSTTLTLPTRVDLQAAIDLKDSFMTAESPLTISASKVNMLSSQGLQVLIAGARHIEANGGSVVVDAPSDGFLTCLKQLGARMDHITEANADT